MITNIINCKSEIIRIDATRDANYLIRVIIPKVKKDIGTEFYELYIHSIEEDFKAAIIKAFALNLTSFVKITEIDKFVFTTLLTCDNETDYFTLRKQCKQVGIIIEIYKRLK